MPQGVGYPPNNRQAPQQGPAKESSQFAQQLQDPALRAALLQFGINMLTPRQGGFGAQLGYGLGGAGQAAGRVSLDRLKRKKEKKEEARADERLDLARRRTDIAERRLERGPKPPASHQVEPFAMWLWKEAQDQAFTPDEALEKFHDPDFARQMWGVWKQMAITGGGQPPAGVGGPQGAVEPGQTVPTQNAPTPPKPGETRKGYRFKGGDPSKRENWEPIG